MAMGTPAERSGIFAARDLVVDSAGGGEGALGGKVQVGVGLGILGFGEGEGRLASSAAEDLLGAQGGGDGVDGEGREVHRHRSITLGTLK